MQKWIGHVAMMSNKISNLIVFEIFDSEHEYLRFCVYRVLLRFAGFKLESARHPCSTSFSVGNLLSTTKRTVENKYKTSAIYYALSRNVTCNRHLLLLSSSVTYTIHI
jgi:hypothetical protein